MWLVAWIVIYRKPHEHPRVKKAELDHINCDPSEPETKIPGCDCSLIVKPGPSLSLSS